MGIFDFLSGKPARFVTDRAYAKNLALMMGMTPMTMKKLRGFGVTPETKLKVTCFFLTNSREKAESLAARLKAFGYQFDSEDFADGKKRWQVVARTKPMPMVDGVVLKWTRQMCEVGLANDCSFEGWETSGAR